MKIKWYGTATLLLESGDTRLLFDPYLKRNRKLPSVPLEEAKTANAVLITHPHLDHFQDVGLFLDAGIPRCFVSQNGIDHAAKQGIGTEKMIPMSAGETFGVGNFTVKTFQSRHCRFDAATVLRILFSPRTYYLLPQAVSLIRLCKKYRIAGDIVAFEVTDGQKTIVILGSAGMDAATEYPQGADMLVFPYQGRARMHGNMVAFLRRFRPKSVFADHFDNAFPPFTHAMNMKKFAPTVEKTLPGARAVVPLEGEWIEV